MTNQEVIAILGELKKCYLGGIVDALDFAIESVKAQEPAKPLERNGFYYCGACRYAFTVHRQKYCTACGKPVRWE